MAIESIVTKLGAEAVNKALSKADPIAPQTGGDSSFKTMLDEMGEMDTGADFAESIGYGSDQNVSPTVQMQSIGAENIDFTPASNVTDVSNSGSSQKVMDMLGEVNKGQMQMDTLVNHILYSGKKFSNQELLVIQAHVFQFAQMTELTVKVAEQGVTSTKAVLNTQVQ